MHFQQIDRVEYEKNVLFEVIFQARFPEIMKISREEPADFQDIIRKEGFPETGSNFQSLPQEIPEEFKKMLSVDKEFYFFSEEGDWQVSLTRSFIALSCKGNYLNYQYLRSKLKKVLEIFYKIYEPSYFSRIGLRYRNIINEDILPLNGQSVRDCIPEYIFPELKQPIAEDVKALEKISQFDDGNIKANVTYTYSQVSGKFRHQQISNKESYMIDIDCFSENKIRGIENTLAKCDDFKKNEWNIFQWSITNILKEEMSVKKL